MTIDLTKILRESMPTFSEARLGRIVKGGPGSGRHTEIHPAFPFGKEGSLEGAKATPEQVAKVLETKEAHEELNRLITGSTEIRNTPVFGGCLMTAQALNIIFPNAVMKASITTSLSHIESATERGGTPQVDHFVLSIDEDKYLDARGVITEPHALDLITSINFGEEPKPMNNGLFFNHLVDATPAIIKDAKGYMSSPEGAPEKFAQYILDHIVSKGGQGSGRHKESDYSQAIRYFSTNGGKVVLATDKTQYTNDLKAFLSAHPDSDGATMALEALGNAYAFVATSNGKAVGALGFRPYANTVSCSFFGTTGEVRGAGASLAQALFQYASDNGFSIRLEPSGEGEDFWGDLGKKDFDGWLMTDEDGYLDWNPAEVKAVASEVFSPVSKGGPGSGRYPKGSKWTTVGRITPEVAEFITTNANKFYKAGGTIIKVKSGATKLPNGKSLDEARSEIHQKAVELANVKRLTPERKRLIEGYQMMRRNLAMLNKENNREAYIALDKDGNIVGVMGAIQHRTGKDWKITELGSTNEISGTATALEHYIATVAGQTNLESVSTADATNYHTAIGRTLAPIIHPFDKTPTGSFTSTWTLEEMQAIAQLPIGKNYLNVEKGGPGSGRHKEGWTSQISTADLNNARLYDAVTKILPHKQEDVSDDPLNNKENAQFAKAKVAKDISDRMGDKFDKQLFSMARIISIGTAPLRNWEKALTADNNFMVQTDVQGVMGAVETEIQFFGKTGDQFNTWYFQDLKDKGAQFFKGDDPELRSLIRQAAISKLVNLWAVSSNGIGTTSTFKIKSLAIQEAAKEQFGLGRTLDWDITPKQQEQLNKETAKNGDLYKAFLQAQYDNTQQFLNDHGITNLPLYRGLYNAQTEWQKQGGEVTINIRPLSSFATTRQSAESFAGGLTSKDRKHLDGNIISATVPADRIFSLPLTGVGCLKEREVVILGGEEKFNNQIVSN